MDLTLLWKIFCKLREISIAVENGKKYIDALFVTALAKNLSKLGSMQNCTIEWPKNKQRKLNKIVRTTCCAA